MLYLIFTISDAIKCIKSIQDKDNKAKNYIIECTATCSNDYKLGCMIFDSLQDCNDRCRICQPLGINSDTNTNIIIVNGILPTNQYLLDFIQKQELFTLNKKELHYCQQVGNPKASPLHLTLIIIIISLTLLTLITLTFIYLKKNNVKQQQVNQLYNTIATNE